jgi:hypothetical protein
MKHDERMEMFTRLLCEYIEAKRGGGRSLFLITQEELIELVDRQQDTLKALYAFVESL